MPKEDYAVSEFLPHGLSKKEIENPYSFFHELFSDYAHLPELRGMLREFMQVTVSGNFHKKSRMDRANMIHFFSKMERLLEVTHLIYEKQETKRE